MRKQFWRKYRKAFTHPDIVRVEDARGYHENDPRRVYAQPTPFFEKNNMCEYDMMLLYHSLACVNVDDNAVVDATTTAALQGESLANIENDPSFISRLGSYEIKSNTITGKDIVDRVVKRLRNYYHLDKQGQLAIVLLFDVSEFGPPQKAMTRNKRAKDKRPFEGNELEEVKQMTL